MQRESSLERSLAASGTTFETKLCYWRVARQRYTALAHLGLKRRVKVEHGSSRASETGVKQLE